MRKYLLFFALILSQIALANPPQKKTEIMDYIFYNLTETGMLRQDRHGFVYVDVPDGYIHETIYFLQEEGFIPPEYFYYPDGVGAHITVMTTDETGGGSITLQENGTDVFFKVKDCQVVDPNWQGVESICILTVEAPNLDRIRQKYGLRKPKHAYHITIGVKQSQEDAA